MSPEERALTPEQEARVSHLLADARADGPMPDAVAERLDGVLAGLASERDGAGDEAVVALAARRRRRVVTMLAAAAAVVVAGVAVGQLVDPALETSAEDASSSLGQAPDRATDADQADGVAAAEDSLPRGEVPTPYSSRELPDALKTFGVPKPVSGRSFAADARRLQRHPGVRSVPGLMDGEDLTAPDRDFMCAEADFGPGKLLAVVYDGSPAVLAFREPHGATQVVDLLQCGSGETIRSTTLSID